MAMIGLETGAFRQGLMSAEMQARQWGSKISGSLGKSILGWGANIGGAYLTASGFARVIKDLGADVKEIKFGSAEMGVSAERFQDLKYAAERSNSSIEAVGRAYLFLAKAMHEASQGNDESIASFKALGVAGDDLKKLSRDDVFSKIQSHIAGLGQISENEVVAMRKVFGRGAGSLMGGMIEGMFAEQAPVKMTPAEYEAGNTMNKISRQGKNWWWGFRPWFREARKGYDAIAALGMNAFGYGGTDWYMGRYGQDQKSIINRSRLTPGVSLGDTLDDLEQSKTDKKEKEKQSKEDIKEKIALLEKRWELGRAQLATDMESMSTSEKLLTLERERNRIAWFARNSKDPMGRLQAALDVEEIDQQRAALARTLQSEQRRSSKASELSLNEQQRIGAYVADPVKNQQLDIAKRSERHLSNIARAVQTTSGGVRF